MFLTQDGALLSSGLTSRSEGAGHVRLHLRRYTRRRTLVSLLERRPDTRQVEGSAWRSRRDQSSTGGLDRSLR